jgi:hypothetical protein
MKFKGIIAAVLPQRQGNVQALSLNVSPLQVIPLLGFPAMF